ncbi:hypothetical protein GOZ96_04825 [Agrobacterium vitis]|uniref:Uncharacterized protein n=1 Tax=Agrobacterium vitis TaxID=373 RepID=A0A7J4X4T4_AGRVI|nr:hypothetical protein [Agrobacterium vitis]KAA3527064.1 hypothetical protein DXT89_14110 [Agrobacterium vitis]MUZ95913.1 hypothetical protein [Agrobacterium vitis]
MVERQSILTAEADPFASLDHCCYMRHAVTDTGQSGYALIDADGELELFSANRSELFFYAAKHELKYVLLN